MTIGRHKSPSNQTIEQNPATVGDPGVEYHTGPSVELVTRQIARETFSIQCDSL